ncbi:hypothetical protein Dimus_029224 [Dionaea muscipula]
MEILTAVVFDCSTREMGLHGSHGRWRCRRQRSSMEMSPAVVFDSFSREKGLHGSHGRWRCRRQRASMEIYTAEKGFDGSHGRWRCRQREKGFDGEQLLFDGFYEFVGAAVEGIFDRQLEVHVSREYPPHHPLKKE